MTLVNFYLIAMIVTMGGLVVIHILCRAIVRANPELMPSREHRYWYNASEVSMAMMCIGGLWFMWYAWDFMVHICLTDPVAGAMMHMPWIFAGTCTLICKSMHFMRLQDAVRALP